CLAILAVLTIVNLRGIRTTGIVFSVPAYAFIGCLFSVFALAAWKAIAHGGHPPPVVAPPTAATTTTTASTWLLLRALANGCTVMTGVEAVSNGVPLFRDPQQKEARRTLLIISGVLGCLLAGVAMASGAYGITATPPGEAGYRSVLSQAIAATV